MNWINPVIGIVCVAIALTQPAPRPSFGLSSIGWVRLLWVVGIANIAIAFIP